MKKIIALALITISLLLIACVPPPSSSDVTRDRQEESLREGAAEVGIPAIVNFRELRLAKDIYELRDQTGLVTYSYIENQIQSIVPGLTALGGKLTFLCTSIGYPLPYAVQFSAPESVQTYNLSRTGGTERYYGVEVLPQAEPNGLYSPGSAEATWVLCKDPSGDTVTPVYMEPKIVASQFKFEPDE